ncbi:MAG: hypothetical protein F4Y75_09550 [Acidimicrobiia bacterium]|nr:zinc-dependent metalloprotease [bacterium]MXX65115.1 hypothetical protein [Acidimicrobiia bacterium]MCY3579265.1 zinc-dependent metalloprotease [bacterium]MCY3652591.1 zinc-dependent metalloprotease [bacterium]MDE0643836.1 zinc-dependent metalloprotease [bacterium]
MRAEHLDIALRVAKRWAGTYPLADSYHRADLQETASTLVGKAGDIVQEETGLEGPGQPEVTVIDRLTWVERNLAFFSELWGSERKETGTGFWNDQVSGRLMAVESGTLLGFLSRRVLGQYELLLPSDQTADHIFLPAPNILEMERRFQLNPIEFRYWVALHEVTHRLQFTGVPWLREYFLDLSRRLVSTSRSDQASSFDLLSDHLRRAIREGRVTIGEAGLMGMMATPEQLELLDQVQALMSMLEGHGHVVMDRIGERQMVTWERMSNLFFGRRHDPWVALLLRLSGLEMKLRQYKDGRRFVLEVEKRAGWSAVDLAWESPESLPTRHEIAFPEKWLARVA